MVLFRQLPAALVCLIISILISSVSAADPNGKYLRKDISSARFGDGSMRAYLQLAYQVEEAVNRAVQGQGAVAKLLQARVVQYFENFGKQRTEPVYLNLMGLPGIGKSSTVQVLQSLGLPLQFFDAQDYTAKEVSELKRTLYHIVKDSQSTPTILVVEEIDKSPEIVDGREVNSPVIAILNQILSDGRMTYDGKAYDASQLLVLTTMNFAPEEIEKFTAEFLKDGMQKSFYDLNMADMTAFNEWLQSQPNSKYKILSHLFRSNTVRRLAPFTLILRPLLEASYREIVDGIIRDVIARQVTKANPNLRIQVGTADNSLSDFLMRETVFPPSGAGETVLRADAIVSQLISFGIKATHPSDQSLDRPRKLSLRVDMASSRAYIQVTPRRYVNKQMVDGPSFEVECEFDRGAGLFLPPASGLAIERPILRSRAKGGRSVNAELVRRRRIEEFRYPSQRNLAVGAAAAINENVFGQSVIAKHIESEMSNFLAEALPPQKEPHYMVLSGFPGSGKSSMVRYVGQHLNLPVISINLQDYTSGDSGTVEKFIHDLYSLLAENVPGYRANPKTAKYILLVEELDKVHEIPPSGPPVDRPVISAIKELLVSGVKTLAGGPERRTEMTVDIRGAFTFITMNFSVDLFGFSADPRSTSIEDVIKAWESLTRTTASIKKLLKSMFLPETVNRLIPFFHVIPPMEKFHYLQVIKEQINIAAKAAFSDATGENLANARVEMTSRYRQLLGDETIIPSEGGRNTALSARAIVAADIRLALSKLPKSKYKDYPIVLTLDYLPSKTETFVTARIDETLSDKAYKQVVSRRSLVLNFPRLSLRGRIPEKRLKTAAHELGHALVGARLGLRFDNIVVVPTNPDAGGFVKFKSDGGAGEDRFAFIFATVASRSIERILLSPNPLDPQSVTKITPGPSADIESATSQLFNLIYTLGFDPWGGTINMNMDKYAEIESMPAGVKSKLGEILRAMENFMVEDLLKFQSAEWFKERIVRLARAGEMSETQFYELIDFKHPGEGRTAYSRTSHVRQIYGKFLENEVTGINKARKQRRGLQKETVEQTADRYVAELLQLIRTKLHPNGSGTLERLKVLYCGMIF